MKSRHARLLVISVLGLVILSGLSGAAVPAWAAPPKNLAPEALTSATSEHNAHYQAKFAVDGKIPPAGSRGADLDAAWCVLKAQSGDRAEFTFEWKTPLDVCEIIYFGRTAWYMNEVWKDYEVYLDPVGGVSDGANKPAAKGSFKMIHGPQRITFARTKVRKITIKFLNSFGGMNPGAAEIMVFGQSPSKQELAALTKTSGFAPMPTTDAVDCEALRNLITEMATLHGERYTARPFAI